MWLDDVWICEDLSFEMREKIVNIATAPCFLADFDTVKAEPSLVRLDHFYRWMTLPAGRFTLKGVENLQRFDTLFHQALGVEDACGLFDVGIWEEDLHCDSFLF